MTYTEKLDDYILELTYTTQQSVNKIQEWYQQNYDILELELGSKLDFLRLEAQKQAKITEVYRQHQLLESITPKEQAIQNELKKHWNNKTCPLLRDAKHGAHCRQPINNLVFNCPHMDRNGLKELFYSDGAKEHHFPCKLNDQEGKS